MKIHAKILNHYLSCSSPVDKEGYLYKKGELNTSYQKRWFTLKGNLLFYQDRRGDREVLGVIVLEGCAVLLCDSDERFAFSLVFGEAGLRTYKFAAEDQASQEGWIKAIHSANHGFLALLLQDLRKQYVEAAEAAGAEPLDDPFLVKDSMNQRSVFYTPPDPKGNNNQLLSAPSTSTKSTSKRSPKLWSKWHAPPAPVNGPVQPHDQWDEPYEDFSQLHEHFGKEVRQLMADWRRKAQEKSISSDGDLINLG